MGKPLTKNKIASVINSLMQGKMCKEVEGEEGVSHPVLTGIRKDLPLFFWNNKYSRGNPDGKDPVTRS